MADPRKQAVRRKARVRGVIKAVIAVMRRHGVDDEQAFRMLRRESMARRITVEELSQQLIEGREERGRRLMAEG